MTRKPVMDTALSHAATLRDSVHCDGMNILSGKYHLTLSLDEVNISVNLLIRKSTK